MAWVDITSYYLRFNAGKKHKKNEKCVVGIQYREDNSPDGQILVWHQSMEADEALFLADMLRNEKPVRFDPETSAIATGTEEVGEGEISQSVT